MRVRFVLVCEGSSDEGLVAHLQSICIERGAAEAIGLAPDFSRLPRAPSKDVKTRILAALALEPSTNVVFVHRDADSRSEEPRINEIAEASAGASVPVVPVVPIQETEAWLLLDEDAIRSVVENAHGTVSLGLPRPRDVEKLADPKEKLKEVLAVASGQQGRRLTRTKREFPRHRALLVERLDPGGKITLLSAWQRLLDRTGEAIQRLRDEANRTGAIDP